MVRCFLDNYFLFLVRYCPKCKEHRQASKKLDLWRLPEILVVHLKRFSYSRYMKNKLDTFVNFPVHNLDLTKYVKQRTNASESPIYELYAISNHYGGLGGGHYSAYAKVSCHFSFLECSNIFGTVDQYSFILLNLKCLSRVSV